MALPPRYAQHMLVFPPTSGDPTVCNHTLEIYLDYACPFSGILFEKFLPTISALRSGEIPLPYGLRIIFRQQIQAWQPSTTLLHETVLAVEKAQTPEVGGDGLNAFWRASKVLFAHQKEFMDLPVLNEKRHETYDRICSALKEEFSDESVKKIRDLLEIRPSAADAQKMNVGNSVTNDMKWHMKLARQTALHVSPTAVWDGIPVPHIDSKFSTDEWLQYLKDELQNE